MSELNVSPPSPPSNPAEGILKTKRSQRFTVTHNTSPPPLPPHQIHGGQAYPSSSPPVPMPGFGLLNNSSILGGSGVGGVGSVGGGGKRDSYAGSEDSNPYSNSPSSDIPSHFFPPATGGVNLNMNPYAIQQSPPHATSAQYAFSTPPPPLPTQSQAYHQLAAAAASTPMGSLKNLRSNTAPNVPIAGGQRGGVPQEWMGGVQPYASPNSASAGLGNNGGDDDVIPTAVVVKNIPFSVKKEQLLQIFEDLQIPAPYAFNYHFDDGIFRGLAFANFRTPGETDAAVAALNGFDVQGRKLRVEYKKVLKEGEKERIEREKAIKRMRSAVLENQRREREASSGGFEESFSNLNIGGGQGQGSSFREQNPGQQGGSAFRDNPNQTPIRGTTMGSSGIQVNVASTSPSDGSDRGSKYELDMNDPQTLEIYSRVLLFKDDSFRDELAFARSLGATQRRIVHLVAQKLDLDHKSVGSGEDRHVVVYKRNPKRQDTLSPEAAYPPATGARLQAKKSMPDMRTYSPNNSPINSRKSNNNLREGYATVGRKVSNSALRGNIQNVFGGYYGANGGSGAGNGGLQVHGDRRVASAAGGDAYGYFEEDSQVQSVPVRQPKGPDSGNGGNFAQRSIGRKAGVNVMMGQGDGEEMQTSKPLEF